jgi:hypothetical protein
MGGKGQARNFAAFTDNYKYGFTAQRAAPFAHEKGVCLRLHPGPIRKPRFHGSEFIRPQRVGRGQALFQTGDVKDAAFGVHLGENQAAGLGNAQTVAEHQEQKATVAGLVPGPLGGDKKLVHFKPCEVFSFVHRFV